MHVNKWLNEIIVLIMEIHSLLFCRRGKHMISNHKSVVMLNHVSISTSLLLLAVTFKWPFVKTVFLNKMCSLLETTVANIKLIGLLSRDSS